MSQRESNKCPVCETSFDADKRLPKIFPTCGHTVCKECLAQVLKLRNPKCPLDQLSFNRDFQSIDAFPTNFLSKDLLESRGKLNQCEVHQEQRKMICITDHTFVCGSCVLFGDHKDHDIKLLSEVQEQASVKKDQISGILNRIVTNVSQSEKSMKGKEETMKETIKQRFNYFYETMKKHEAQMLFKLDKMLGQEKTAIKNPVLDDKASEIKKKLQEFPQILADPKLIMGVLKEDFTELEKTVTHELTVASQKMEEFTSLLAIFENSLPKEDFLKDLKAAEILNQSIAEFSEKRKFSLEVFIPSGLSFNFKNDKFLEVRKVESTDSKEDFLFERSKLEQVEKVKYLFDLEDETTEKDKIVPALLNLSKVLPNTKAVIFDFEAKQSSETVRCDDERLQKILLATLSQPENIEKLEFLFSGYVLGDLGFLFLAENALPKITNLKSFSIKMGNTKVSNQVLKALARINWKTWSHLEKLKIDIPEPSFEGSDLAQFLNVVPNVKEFTLGLGNSQLTDQAIEDFSTKILPSFDKLERFEVGFWGTKLTDTGVEKFLMNIPNNVKTLLIGLGRVAITDDSVKSFLKEKLPSLTGLKDFGFDSSQVGLSEDIAKQVKDREKEIRKSNCPRYKLPEETWADSGKKSQGGRIIKNPFGL